ncbi:MAG: TraR/DksA C4-type zinc finger protein [bacterium]|nr:MAG: TraR/DksA C4-type zinc finger protein [bacterium]
MRQDRLEKYRKMLLEMRQEYQAELQKVSNEEKNRDRTEAKDSVDQADSNYSVDYQMARTEKINRGIKEVDEALNRIRNGEYGVCQVCGDEIPEGRLQVRPNALYCAQCKEDLEKRGEIK